MDRFRQALRQTGSTQALVVSGVLTALLLGGGVASLATGAQARKALNQPGLTPQQRRTYDSKSFLMLLGAVLLMVGILSALWLGKNLLARFAKK